MDRQACRRRGGDAPWPFKSQVIEESRLDATDQNEVARLVEQLHDDLAQYRERRSIFEIDQQCFDLVEAEDNGNLRTSESAEIKNNALGLVLQIIVVRQTRKVQRAQSRLR